MYLSGRDDNGLGFAVLPLVGALGSGVGLVGSLVGLLGGKEHKTPWGFLYDDYPQHIWESEMNVVNLQNAINKFKGLPELPPPPMYQKTGGAQYQASMQAIVPKYVPGSAGQIAAYDRKLNEPGGAYEKTLQLQLQRIQQLQSEAASLGQAAQAGVAMPATGSATAPAPILAPPSAGPFGAQASPIVQPIPPMQILPLGPPTGVFPISPYSPYPAPYISSSPYLPTAAYQAGSLAQQLNPGLFPASFAPSQPIINIPSGPSGIIPASLQTSGDTMSQYMPYILGGGALLLTLMMGGKSSPQIRYRTIRPRRRR